MDIGSIVTIHSHSKSWPGAKIIGQQKDTLDGTRDVFVVEHLPYFETSKLHFYCQADSQGRHYQPANAAFWITEN